MSVAGVNAATSALTARKRATRCCLGERRAKASVTTSCRLAAWSTTGAGASERGQRSRDLRRLQVFLQYQHLAGSMAARLRAGPIADTCTFSGQRGLARRRPELPEGAGEAGQERRRQRIVARQRGDETQIVLDATVDFDGLPPP